VSAQERQARIRARQQCRARFSLKHAVCEDCFYAAARERHHVDGDPRNNTPENVRLLCRSCHHRAHSGDRWHQDRDSSRYAA
jgi:5-methylcytosine-specific restriction endonuclease McrA